MKRTAPETDNRSQEVPDMDGVTHQPTRNFVDTTITRRWRHWLQRSVAVMLLRLPSPECLRRHDLYANTSSDTNTHSDTNTSSDSNTGFHAGTSLPADLGADGNRRAIASLRHGPVPRSPERSSRLGRPRDPNARRAIASVVEPLATPMPPQGPWRLVAAYARSDRPTGDGRPAGARHALPRAALQLKTRARVHHRRAASVNGRDDLL